MTENLDLSKLRFPTPSTNGHTATREEVVSTDTHARSVDSVTEAANTPASVPMSFSDLYTKFDIIDVLDNGTVLATAKDEIQLAEPGGNEKGYAMTSSGGGVSFYAGAVKEDYNFELRGQLGLKKFDEMRRSDAQVRSSLRQAKTPVIAGKWYIEPASQSAQDRKIARFVDWNLKKAMTTSWTQVLVEALLMLDFGSYLFEKVFYYRLWEGNIHTCWRKWGPRHPIDVEEWQYDSNGGLKAIKQLPTADQTQSITIPIEELLVFTFDKEAGNAQGISLLRSAYQSWYFKKNLYKIDAIQKERHGIGIPIIKLPPQYNAEDKALAGEIGRNLRTNERTHVALPMGWEIVFAELHGNPVDVIKSIDHHDHQIAKNVLAGFLDEVGQGSGEVQNDIFLKSSRFIADIVRDVINKYAIPELVDYNWDVTDYPELRVRRIGETVDWRTLSMALRNLVGAKIIIPDDKLEEWARYEMDLPEADRSTSREVATPQLPEDGDEGDEGEPGAPNPPQPPSVGLPRQSQAGNMNNRPGVGRGDSPRTA